MKNNRRPTQVIRIETGGLYRLDGPDQHVTIIDGLVWITAEGKDIIACAGETLVLDGSREPILISGLKGKGVTIQVGRTWNEERERILTPAYRITPRTRKS